MEKKIIKAKNGTIITPYHKGDCPKLERYTSIFDTVYRTNVEHTGFCIDNYMGESAFITHKQSDEFLSTNFPDYKMEEMELVQSKKMYQKFALKKFIKFKPVQNTIAGTLIHELDRDKYKEFFINLQTGGGKTLLGVWLSAYLCIKTMIFCFSTEILKQWEETYKDKTSKNMETIMYINSGSQLTDIINNPKDYKKIDIFLLTPVLISSFMKHTDYSILESITNILGIGLFIIDEAHRNMSNISKINAVSNVKYTLYLSADYAQGDYKKEKLFYNIFRNTLIIKPEADWTMKYTKVVVIDYNTCPSMADESSIYNRYGFSANNYMRYEIKNGMIYKIIRYLIDSILMGDNNYRTLILFTQIRHVDLITKYLKRLYPSVDIGRYHGNLDDEEKSHTKDKSKIIVSTYKSFSTGLDTNDIKYVITTNQSNKVEDNQAAGRARPLADGTDAVFFMLVDSGFMYCKNKLKQRISYLKDTKLKEDPFKLRLSNKDLK